MKKCVFYFYLKTEGTKERFGQPNSTLSHLVHTVTLCFRCSNYIHFTMTKRNFRGVQQSLKLQNLHFFKVRAHGVSFRWC